MCYVTVSADQLFRFLMFVTSLFNIPPVSMIDLFCFITEESFGQRDTAPPGAEGAEQVKGSAEEC